MEAEEIQTQACKFSRIGNTRSDSSKISQQQGGSDQYHDEDEDDGERKAGIGGGSDVHLREWNHSSRIFRVSRASGGKDRHSKVVTAKGLRDRRVRLSVSTAIQFYDLQDRLGVDQPSKAVEWLIKAAAGSIAELPSLESKFPETPKQPTEVELDTTDTSYQQQQHMSLTKSACSSTSETSKGSVSLSRSRSRSEIRVKARERARERTAKDKEKEKEKQKDDSQIGHQQNSQNSSFTELLTGGSNIKTRHHFPSTTSMDYFSSGLFNPASSRTHYSSGFSNQTHFGIPPPPSFNGTSDPHQHHHHHELQQFSFLPDHHLISDTTAVTGGDYNLHFTISSSGLAGLNRGTLQSNSPSPLPHHLQRFSSSADGPNMPFFVGNVASVSPTENHYFPAGYDSSRHSDLKGKGKS